MTQAPPKIVVTSIDPSAVEDDPALLEGIARVAGQIAADANRSSRRAKIGITTETMPDRGVVRIGPRGAAGLPVEIGTARVPARRYVKRALDRAER